MADKVAVVTGGNKGIGYAIVKGLCESLKGYDVILTARDEVRGMAAVERLKQEHGVTCKYFPLDITSKASIDTLKNHLQNTYGGVDVLINNAGVAFWKTGPISFPEAVSRTVDVNFNGPLNVFEALLPLLRKGARVVNIGSVLASVFIGHPSDAMAKKIFNISSIDTLKSEMASYISATKEGTHKEEGYLDNAYAMSKFGIIILTEMQQQMIDNGRPGSDIIISCVCPGYTKTDMTANTGVFTIFEAADTPVYLASLPAGSDVPKGAFWSHRKIVDWRSQEGRDASIKEVGMQPKDCVYH